MEDCVLLSAGYPLSQYMTYLVRFARLDLRFGGNVDERILPDSLKRMFMQLATLAYRSQSLVEYISECISTQPCVDTYWPACRPEILLLHEHFAKHTQSLHSFSAIITHPESLIMICMDVVESCMLPNASGQVSWTCGDKTFTCKKGRQDVCQADCKVYP